MKELERQNDELRKKNAELVVAPQAIASYETTRHGTEDSMLERCVIIAKQALSGHTHPVANAGDLPTLPAPAGTMQVNWGTPYQKDVDAYTEDQMRGYVIDDRLHRQPACSAASRPAEKADGLDARTITESTPNLPPHDAPCPLEFVEWALKMRDIAVRLANDRTPAANAGGQTQWCQHCGYDHSIGPLCKTATAEKAGSLDERKAFDKWHTRYGKGFTVYSEFNSVELTAAWKAWQARAELDGYTAVVYGYIARANDGHETFFKGDPATSAFNDEKWRGLMEVIPIYRRAAVGAPDQKGGAE